MRICLDLRFKTRSGASSYIENLVPALFRLADDMRFVLVKYRDQSFPFESQADAVIVCPRLPTALQILWTNTVLPLSLRALRVDIYHALKLTGYYWKPRATVMTMHSLLSTRDDKYPTSFQRKLFIRFFAEWLIHRAGRFIAVADFLKGHLVAQYGVDAGKIDVAYHGVSDPFCPMDLALVGAARAKFGLTRDYLLCVGNVFPVKNHLTAVHAFAEVAKRHDLDLVIVGNTSHSYCRRIETTISTLGLQYRVKLLGFQEGRDVAALMNGARVLLFPSLTEGCPISLLEAFRCGLPVIASHRGGLGDVGRDAAIFVDNPMDHGAFAREIARYLTTPELEADLRRHALAKAPGFSWENSARIHLAAYKKLTT